jgi:predicted secreted protein
LINSSSVIRAAIPAARGAKPGQYRVTDRVARAAQYSVAWRKDAFLKNAELRTDARERAAVVPRKPQNFAAAFARAQARAEARVEEAKRAARAENKTERAEKMSREDWERHFELSRRARVKLTDAGDARDEGRGFFTKKKTSPSPVAAGGTTRESKPRGRSPREFTPPCDKRRDDVRWEVRRRMAAPPVLSR